MNEAKIFKVVMDGNPITQIPIYPNATIGSIKKYFEKYLKSLDKQPDDYSIYIYLDNHNKLDIEGTDKYDTINLSSVWNKIKNGMILLISSDNYFNRLYSDLIYQIAVRVDLPTLTRLCQTEKRLSKICDDEIFWMNRAFRDYGAHSPDSLTWKKFYEIASSHNVHLMRMNAIENNQIDLVKVAMNRGANINWGIPLVEAARYGYVDIVKFLLEWRGSNGVYIDIFAQGNKALLKAIVYGRPEVVKILLDWRGPHGERINILENGDEAFRAASKAGNPDTVKLLIDWRGPRGEYVDVSKHDYALSEASYLGYTGVVKLMLEWRGPGGERLDIHAEEDEALEFARMRGHSEIVKLFLEH